MLCMSLCYSDLSSMNSDTICAIATAPGGALGIIRISGAQALEILSSVFSKDLTAILCYPAGRNEKAYSIPEGVARIGDTCFAGSCLEKVDIPDSVLTIETGAFELCGLKSIDLPPHLQTIGEAVIYATSIESVVIPASVQRIADNAFSVCSSLKSIDVEEGNVFYSSKEGVLFDAAKTTLCCYPAGKTTGEYVIPEGVTEIRRFAIAGCAFLTKVTLPDSLLSIGDNAFAFCFDLTGDLVIPNSVTHIGESAFFQCEGLDGKLIIGESVSSIGDWAFRKCSHISEAVSLATTPATLGNELGGTAFAEFGIQTLTVPCGCIEAYQNSSWHDPYGLDGFSEFIEDCTVVSEVDAVVTVVYPNPTYGKVRIEAESIQSISIFNMLGEKVFECPAYGDTFEYDFSQQKAGMYFIKMETAKGFETIKVTVR